ncbi:Sarcosine dehydrogenase, mitochondrial, partial [Zootermopsis nevadensis]
NLCVSGGGSQGCNTLYQLTKRGVKAVLLERAKLTSGTTWHTAGCIWRLRPNDVDTILLNDTRDVLMQLEPETGIDPGWIMNGGIFIAYNEERLDEYRRLATMGVSFGIESSILDPEETKKVFPLIDADVIQGSLYSPGDGIVDPSKLSEALTQSAIKGGGQVLEKCPLTSILTGKNGFGAQQITGVITPFGSIKTNCIVNCCGVWSREVTAMVGLHLPLVPMKHAYVVTENIPEVQGLPNIRDHDASIYFRVQEQSLCMGGYESNPILLEKVPHDFEFSLYELDWIVFSRHMRGAVNLIPKFETAGIKGTVCGPESFTPDHKPLLGEDPRLHGLYHNCGYNAAGTMLSGGCSDQLAQWIIHGRPTLHMFDYDIRRFTPEQRKDAAWVFAKSHESYATNYDIVFPHDEDLAGRNFHQGPFHQEMVDAGCVFEERQGYERPGWFSPKGPAPVPNYDWYGSYGTPRNSDVRYENMLKSDHTFDFSKIHHVIGEECLACREQVALFDMSQFGKLYMCGPDAQKAADWLFTADTHHPISRTVYTCLLNTKAGVEADVIVSAIETGTGGLVDPIFKGRGFYIVTNGLSAYHTWAHIYRILSEKNFKVGLTDLSEKIGVLSVQGPNSRDVLQPLVNTSLGDEEFPYSTTHLVRVADHLCRAVRISSVGELGWQLHIPWDSCSSVYKAILEQGKKYGLRHAGYRALNSLSSEKGYHLWNADLRTDDNPLEAGLDLICREDGDYVGKEALDVIKQKGLKKKLAFFQLQKQIPVWGLETIWRDDQVVGFLRRGEYGYALGASIGQGYVKHPEGRRVTPEFLQNGHYQVEVMGNRYDVSVYFKSPFDPNGKRPLGIYDEQLPIRQ